MAALKKWTDEMLAAEAAKYKTRGEFKRGNPKAYYVAISHKIIDQICKHTINGNLKWNKKTLADEAAKYQTRREFELGSYGAYQAAGKRKLLDDICSHMKAQRIDWTNEMLAAEAAKYQTRIDFKNRSSNAYDAAQYRKILDKICSHMDSRFWTIDELRAEASKYQTRSDFKHNSPAYSAAVHRKMLDQICSHMVDGSGTDNDTIYIWRAEREYFNGNPVYKIGITSWRLGQRRINHVAQKAGFDSSIIVFKQVSGKATDLEKKLLSLGDDPKYADIDGATEFRALSPAALDAALAIVSEAI